MKMLRNALVLIGLVGLLGMSSAFAGPKFSIVGVGNLPMPTATSAAISAGGTTISSIPSPTGVFGFGGGALIEIPFGTHLGLEIGGLYMQRKFSMDWTAANAALGVTNYSLSALEVPVTFNIHLHRMIFLSVGGYVSSVFGTGTGTGADGTALTVMPSDLFQRPMNFGLVGGLGFNIPLGTAFAFRAEGRYHLALQNQFDDATTAADTTASWKQNELQIYAGLTFGGGSK